MSEQVPSKEQVAKAIDDKDAECHWDGLWNEQKDGVATRAGLLRSSAFTRSLPYWRGLPDDWHEPLSKLLRADREKRQADEAARRAETERHERAELARLLGKYGAAHEPPAECSRCRGSGEVRAMTQEHGPDDYEFDAECPECKGVGVVSRAAQPPGVRPYVSAAASRVLNQVKLHNEDDQFTTDLRVLVAHAVGECDRCPEERQRGCGHCCWCSSTLTKGDGQ